MKFKCVSLMAGVLLLCLCIAPVNAITVTSITPASGYNTGPLTITDLAGTGFTPGASLILTPVNANPVHAGSIVAGAGTAPFLNDPQGLFVAGNYAYVTSGTSNALEIVDVTDPTNPVHKGSIVDGAGGALLNLPTSVFVVGNYAYVTSFSSNALEIVDVTDPANPAHAGSLPDGGIGAPYLDNARGVYVVGNYAYVVSYGNEFEIIDVSNPAAPAHVGWTTVTGNPNSVYVVGNYAYVTCPGSDTLEIVDITNKAAPAVVGSIVDGTNGAHLGEAYSVYVAGNYAYVAARDPADNALEIVDVTDPANPVHAGSIVNGAGGALLVSPYSVYVSGNYAFVASDGSNALEIVDVTDPTNPVHKGSIVDGAGGALLSGPISVFVPYGNYAYVGSFASHSLEIVDIGTITGTGNVTSQTQIIGTVDLTGRTPGRYNVVVTNPDGQFSTLPGGFTVMAPTGDLSVTSSPSGAHIYLDGPDSGFTTPHTFSSISTGYHHVKVTLTDYYDQEKSVYVVGGTTTAVDFALDPITTNSGIIDVRSNIAGAEIFIDGIDTGEVTPFTFNDYLGDHAVKITYPGYFDAQRPVYVAENGVLETYIRMDPIPSTYTGKVLTDIQRILKEEVDDDTSESNAYSSPDPLPASEPITLWGVQPAITSPPTESTVVFIDPDPGMNWEHLCYYVFIDQSGEKTVIPAMSPSLDLGLEQISGTGYDPAGMDLNMIGSGTTPSSGGGLGNLPLSAACTSPDCAGNYAVLINGGYDTENNHLRYWNDISFMYQTLNKVYGYPKDHIKVLMSDGINPGSDRHYWTNADGTILTDSSPLFFDGASGESQVTGGANLAELTKVFGDLRDSQDIANKDIFIFTTGHGAWDPNHNGGEAFLYLWDRQFIYASDFVSLLPQNAKSITIVMEQCNSGGFVNRFIINNPTSQPRMIATAAAWNQPSKDNGFSSTWTMAAARIDNYMQQGAFADLPAGAGDGKINIWEATEYARKNDPYRSVESPQYREVPSLQGQSQFLHTCNAVANSLRITSPLNGYTWSTGYTNNITWGQTGLDQTTVTVSLWNRTPLTKVLNICAVTANTRFCRWTPSKTAIKAGNDYVIKIASNPNPQLADSKTISLLAYATAGKLNVTSVLFQRAYVNVDGLNTTKYTNTTSILGISPGTHTVGVTKSGYKDDEVIAYVNSNKYTTVPFTLQLPGDNAPGHLVVTASPVEAEVLVMNETGYMIPTGLMTPFNMQYPPGTYTVGVKAFGYIVPPVQTVTVGNNRPVVLDFTLGSEPWRETEMYATNGFITPIDMEGTLNIAKAGQNLPVKWHLSNLKGDVADLSSFVALRSNKIDCDELTGGPVDLIEQVSSTSGLQYLGEGNWQYNWKTPKTYAGTCREMYIEFLQGQRSPVAYFKFK